MNAIIIIKYSSCAKKYEINTENLLESESENVHKEHRINLTAIQENLTAPPFWCVYY